MKFHSECEHTYTLEIEADSLEEAQELLDKHCDTVTYTGEKSEDGKVVCTWHELSTEEPTGEDGLIEVENEEEDATAAAG